MLLITADDYGKNASATDNTLDCHAWRRITSASAMVFMEDSERAAALALETGIDVGLHLNFTQQFTGNAPCEIHRMLAGISSYLSGSRLAQILYNPLLAKPFRTLFEIQREEFVRLYGRPPGFYNGHHHMHLCANVLAADLIPRGARVRRAFAFEKGEKSMLNRAYRNLLNRHVTKKFITSDYVYSFRPLENTGSAGHILRRAASSTVEIEVHPELVSEKQHLLSVDRLFRPAAVQLGCFGNL